MISPECAYVREETRRYFGSQSRFHDEGVSNLDWSQVLSIAQAHQIEVLLRNSFVNAPAEITDIISKRLQDNELRKSVLLDEARRLTVELDEKGIEHVFLKGAVLASHGYKAAGDRPLTDIDLLVTPAKLNMAAEVLKALGYLQTTRQKLPDEWYRKNLNQTLPWERFNGRGIVEVDLHFSLIYRYLPFFSSVNVPELLDRSVIDEVTQLPRLRAHDMALHQCLHATLSEKGRTPRLRLLTDVVVVQDFADFDVQELRAWERTPVWKFVVMANHLIGETLGKEYELPDVKRPEEYSSAWSLWIADKKEGDILTPSVAQTFSPIIVASWLDNWRDRARYLIRVKLIPDRTKIASRYLGSGSDSHPNAAKIGIAYLRNLVRVIRKYWSRSVGDVTTLVRLLRQERRGG